MNAAPVIKETKLIDIDLIKPSPVNQRNFKGKEADLESLAQNIKAHGLIQAITVRASNGNYELVCGERRWRACKLIWEQIPAIVLELTDLEANEITVTENLQREDLTPIQEANGIQILLKSGKDVKEIADRLGKPVSWVVRRAKLKDLSTKWKSAIEDPEHVFAKWSASHLELIARFQKNIQDEIFDLKVRHYGTATESIKELRNDLNCYLLKLSAAPWKLTEPDIYPKAGACNTCKKRTSIQPDLFENEKDQKKSDSCTDKTCWAKKLELFLELKEKALRRSHKNLLLLDTGFYLKRILPEDAPIRKKVIHDAYLAAKKSDKDSSPALVIDGPDAGQLKWIKFYENRSKPNMDDDGNKMPKTLEERRADLEKKRQVNIAKKVKEIIEAEIEKPDRIRRLADHWTPLKISSNVLVFGCEDSGFIGKEKLNRWDQLDLRFDFLNRMNQHEEELYTEILRRILNVFNDNLLHQINYTQPKIDIIEKIAYFVGIDIESIKLQVIEETPEPKTWANLNEDGTPKRKGKKAEAEGTGEEVEDE